MGILFLLIPFPINAGVDLLNMGIEYLAAGICFTNRAISEEKKSIIKLRDGGFHIAISDWPARFD